MKDLMITQNQTLTMSSREIAELTGKEHKHVKRDIDKLCAEINRPNLDRSKYTHRGNIYTEYNLDKDLTLCLISGYNAKIRMSIIKRWQELESNQAPQLPQSFAEALQLAADQAKKLELAAPKVEFHDKVVNDENTFSFRDAAKKIQQRPNKLIDWLRGKGYLCLNNMAKQQYIAQGLFATHSGVSDAGHHYTQCRVTGKGLSYFIEKLGSEKL